MICDTSPSETTKLNLVESAGRRRNVLIDIAIELRTTAAPSMAVATEAQTAAQIGGDTGALTQAKLNTDMCENGGDFRTMKPVTAGTHRPSRMKQSMVTPDIQQR
jgi:hypothetical protein